MSLEEKLEFRSVLERLQHRIGRSGPGGSSRSKAAPEVRQATAALLATALLMPLAAMITHADQPIDEVVVTAGQLLPTTSSLGVRIHQAGSTHLFSVVGLSDTTGYENLPLDEFGLRLKGEFPVRIQAYGASPSDLPLYVTFEDVSIDRPNGGAPFGLANDANVNLRLVGSSTLTASADAGVGVPTGTNLVIGSTTAGTLSTTGVYRGAGIGAQGTGSNGGIAISGNAVVKATGGSEAAGIGSSGYAPPAGGAIAIRDTADVTAIGGDRCAGIGGAHSAPAGSITITDQASVRALAGRDASAIGGGYYAGIGEITISGQAKVMAVTKIAGAAIGGNGPLGSQSTDFVKITGSPIVAAFGSVSSIGGAPQGVTEVVSGSVTIESGFVVAFGSIGRVTGPVTISGGSVHARGLPRYGPAGATYPVNGDGVSVYPLYIPAYEGGTDLTDLDLTAPPFAYAQHTVTPEQRAWIDQTPDSFEFSTTMNDMRKQSRELAAVLWVPQGVLSGLTLRDPAGTYGFGATIAATDDLNYAPDLPTNILRHHLVNVQVSADGTANQETSTKLELSFSHPVEHLTAAHVAVTDGTVSAVADPSGWASNADYTVWTLPLSSVSGEGTVNVDIPQLGQILDGYLISGLPATVPVHAKRGPDLTPGAGTRTALNAGAASFGASAAGRYHYLVALPSELAPTAAAVVAGGNSGTKEAGANTIGLGVDDLKSNGSRVVVYVVGEDAEGNLAGAPIAITVGAFSAVTLTHNPGGSVGEVSPGYVEGTEVPLQATPDAGYQFASWDVTAGGDNTLLTDRLAANTALTIPGESVSVHATFAKKPLTVRFDVNKPADAPEDTSGWAATGTGRIEEPIGAPPAPPPLADFEFVGWYPTALAPGAADPEQAWDFASDLIDAPMIDGDSVTLHAAWTTAWSEVRYDLNDSSASPATPASLGPDRARIGSKIVDAASYSEGVRRAGGFKFGGWFLDSDLTVPVTDSSTVPAGHATLHAMWLEEADTAYFVFHYKVDAIGRETLADTDSPVGRIGTPSAQAQPKDYPGYIFNAGRSSTAGEISAGLELKLYYDVRAVAVVFDAGDGGSGGGTATTGHYDELAPAWDNPTRSGFAFKGWKSSTVGLWDFQSHVLTEANGVVWLNGTDPGRLELTAIWAARPAASGASAIVALGGNVNLIGTVTPDAANGASIFTAQVTTDEPWVPTATISPTVNGTVHFEAGTLPAGTYAFTVRYTDTNGLTGTADFTVKVAGLPTVEGNTVAVIPEGGQGSFTIAVTSDAPIDSVWVTGAPAGSTVVAQPDGTVSFDAGSLPGGQYTFGVTYTDEVGQNSPTVGFTVTVQAAPTGAGRSIELENDRILGYVLPLGDAAGTNLQDLTASSYTAPSSGSFQLDANRLIYTPQVGLAGTVPFEVTVCDDLGQCLNLEYSFTILSVFVEYSPPAAAGDSAIIGLGGSALLEGSVTTDSRATVVSRVVTTADPWVAQATIDAAIDGTVRFEAGTLAPGMYEFTVLYTDSNDLTGTAGFWVLVVAPPEVDGDATDRIRPGETAVIELTVTTVVTIESTTVTDVPAGATVQAGTDGKITFDGSNLPEGEYSFDVTFTDSLGQTTDPVTVTVIIQGPPTAASNEVRERVRWNGQVTFTESVVSTNGQIVGRGIEVTPDEGTASLDPVRYDATGASGGEHPFVVRYVDNLGQSITVRYIPTVQIPPVGTGRQFTIDDDRTVLDIDVLSDITGTALQPLTDKSFSRPSLGSVSVNGDKLRYTPQVGRTGTVDFLVAICDDLDQCAELRYSVTIKAVRTETPATTPPATTPPATTPPAATPPATAAPLATTAPATTPQTVQASPNSDDVSGSNLPLIVTDLGDSAELAADDSADGAQQGSEANGDLAKTGMNLSALLGLWLALMVAGGLLLAGWAHRRGTFTFGRARHGR
ncbi:MAG: InlB B-repeat-containing protein [Bifidobacteriaceae bacterium]|jgi:hypothetical protein|nr:InlB B-repeat-containing protein [Bifidobacteriaceae bacterium]